jgi:hypothetical protein
VLELGATLPGAYLLKRGLFMPWELPAVIDPELARAGLCELGLLEHVGAVLEPDPGLDHARIAVLESSLYMRNQLLRRSVAAAATAVTAAAATATTAAATTVTAAAAATATAATAAVTATTAAAEATATGRTWLHRTGFVDNQTTATVLLAVHGADSGLRFSFAAHFDETKALRAAGIALHHDFGAGNGTVGRKGLLEVFVAEGIGQVAHVKFVAHQGLLKITQNAMESDNRNQQTNEE